MRVGRAFTVIEVLVVIAIVSILLAVLMPALSHARGAARRVACLSNMRSIEQAHWAYLTDTGGRMLGTSHGGSWIDVLRGYSEGFALRSPVDTSPHFDDPIDGVYRVTSYAINYWVSPDNPNGTARIDAVPMPSATGHLAIKAFEGPGAVRDHYHPHLWWSPIAVAIPGKAAGEVQTNAHGGEVASWDAVSTYGFLDGHAESRAFVDVYESRERNCFDPSVAH